MTFDLSSFNWFSLAAFLPLAVVVCTARKRHRPRLDVAAAAVLSICLFAALADVVRFHAPAGTCRLFLVDCSGSAAHARGRIREEFDRQAALAAAAERGNDTGFIVRYGRDCAVAAGPISFKVSGSAIPDGRYPDPDGTDTAGAVQFAMGLVPAGFTPEITIIGDGTDSRPQVEVPPGIECTYLDAGGAVQDAAVISLKVPDHAVLGQAAAVAVTIHALQPGPANVRLYEGRSGAIIDALPLDLAAGLNAVRFDVHCSRPGAMILMAEVEAEGDVCPENDILRRTVRVTDPDSAECLILGGPFGRLPAGCAWADPAAPLPADLARYSTIIMNNVAVDILPAAAAQALAAFAREGGGLLVTGTDRIFGLGGYSGSPLEAVLPLNSKPQVPSDAPKRIMIAVDRSGSMDELLDDRTGRKLDAAKAAALQFILNRETGPYERIGLLFFSAETEVVKQPADEADEKLLRERLAALAPHGGTRIIKALETARAILAADEARDADRYIFIITDGITREKVADEDLQAVAAALKKDDISLLALKIGVRPSTVLSRLCRLTGGTYRESGPGENIVTRFEREGERTAADLAVSSSFRPAPGPGAALCGMGTGEGALCEGYIRTSLNPGSLAVWLNPESREPLAAIRFVGAGRTAAIAGVRGEAAAVLLNTLSGWVRGSGQAAHADLEIGAEGLTIRVEAADPVPAGTEVTLKFRMPDGTTDPVRLSRVNASVFTGTAPIPINDAVFEVLANGVNLAAGQYHPGYAAEYHPLRRYPVRLMQPAGPVPDTGPGRSYMLFVALFLAVLALGELFRTLHK